MGRTNSQLIDRMVFLVGARRSGTNWLQRMVCAHPDAVAIPSETHLFSHGLAPLADRFQHGSVGSPKTATVFLARDDMHDLLRDVADRVFGGVATSLAPEARLIVERTPWHAYHLDLIGSVYPDAAVVHIVRDGRDVARSLLSQPWGPTTMHEAAEEWRSSVEAARAGAGRVGRYLEVRYEALLADPAGGIRSLYDWLGLAADQAAVARALDEASIQFNADARNPAAAQGKWRAELSRADVRTFGQVAGTLLQELGYDPAPGGASGPASAAVRSAIAKRRRAVRTTDLSQAGRPSLNRPFEPVVESVGRMEQVQHLLDRWVGAFDGGDTETLNEMLTDTALVRRVGRELDVSGRDADSRRGFLQHVAERSAQRAMPGRSETLAGSPMSVVLLRDPSPDAAARWDTLVLWLAGAKVDRVVWFQSSDVVRSEAHSE